MKGGCICYLLVCYELFLNYFFILKLFIYCESEIWVGLVYFFVRGFLEVVIKGLVRIVVILRFNRGRILLFVLEVSY